MDKRYQVFVSSTFADLQPERQAVMQALLSLDHFPAGMELFPASDEDQWALIKGVIDDSDYYILVIGGRYGSTNEGGISYTEMEFDYAKAAKKPILAFIHQSPELIPAGKTELSDKARERLAAFKKKVESGRHIKFWNSPDDLKAKVIQSISAETKRNPQEGWVRATKAVDPSLLELLRQEIDRLREQLASSRSEAPQGSEVYASGTDEYSVEISYRDTSWFEHSQIVDVTWNTIFFEVGPSLMEEASEAQMKRRLASEIWKYDRNAFPDSVRNPTISDDSFDTIKIQLVALGLIQKSDKRHVPSDTNRYWALTPYGETMLMTLRAIPKRDSPILLEKSDDEADDLLPNLPSFIRRVCSSFAPDRGVLRTRLV